MAGRRLSGSFLNKPFTIKQLTGWWGCQVRAGRVVKAHFRTLYAPRVHGGDTMKWKLVGDVNTHPLS